MSKLIAAATRSSGTVGWATQCFEPSSPFSSASQCGEAGSNASADGEAVNALANSSTADAAAGVVVGAGMNVPVAVEARSLPP